MNTSQINFLRWFIILGFIELVSNFLTDSFPFLHYIFKPSIMASLGIYFWIESGKLFGGRHKRIFWMLVSIAFAWLGDFFLMFSGDLYFQLGLGSFLLMQIGYIFIFWTGSFSSISQLAAFLILSFGLFIFYLIYPHLGSLFLPVLVYMFTITFMVLTTLNRKGKVLPISFQWVFLGAILFMISDSLIAIEKFFTDVPLRQIWVMLTYISAQYLIVEGFLKELRSHE